MMFSKKTFSFSAVCKIKIVLFFFSAMNEIFRQVFHSLDLFGYFLEQCEKVTGARSFHKRQLLLQPTVLNN